MNPYLQKQIFSNKSSPRQDVHTTRDSVPSRGSFSSADLNQHELTRREMIFFLRRNLSKLTSLVSELDDTEKVCEEFEKGDLEHNQLHHDRYMRSRERFSTILQEFAKKSEFMFESIKSKAGNLELLDRPLTQYFDPSVIKGKLKYDDRSIFHARFNEAEGVVTSSYSVPDERSNRLLYVVEAYDYEADKVVFKRESFDEGLKVHCPFFVENGQLYDIARNALAQVKLSDQSYCLSSLFQLDTDEISCFFQFKHGVATYLGVGTVNGTYFFIDNNYSFNIHLKSPQKVIHVPGTDLLIFLQHQGKITLFDMDTLETKATEMLHDEVHAMEFYRESNLLLAGTKGGKVMIWKLLDKNFVEIKKLDDFVEVAGLWMYDENILAVVEKADIRFYDVLEGQIIGMKTIGNERYDPIKNVFWDQDLKKVVMLSFEKWFEIDY